MNGEMLLQNVFNLLIIAIILEASVMAIFTLSPLKSLEDNSGAKAARDVIVLVAAFFLCYKVYILTIFKGTGIRVPYILDTIISALVLTRMANLIRDFLAKIKYSD